MQVNIESIQVNSGRREALPDAVRELADSISAVGLLNPITVDRDYTLIAGLHRLEAAKLLGWAEIECNVSSLEGLQAELAEIDENFVRADLETLEFGKLLLRRKEIYEMLHPQVKNGGDRKSEKIRTRRARSDSDKSFVRDTADKLGISTRSVEEKIQIARDMTPRAQEIVQDAGRKIKKKDLVKLSRMEPKQQEQAAAQLAAGEIKSADEFRQEEPPKPSKPPEPAHEPERSAEPVTEPLALPTVPYSLGDRHYDTLEESIADLKNPDKDCSYTPDSLLAELDSFIEKFHREFAWYSDPFCAVAFPDISQVQLDYLQKRFSTISTAIHDLLKQMKRSMKK